MDVAFQSTNEVRDHSKERSKLSWLVLELFVSESFRNDGGLYVSSDSNEKRFHSTP